MFSTRHPRSGRFPLPLTLAALRPLAAVHPLTVLRRFAELGRAGLIVRAAERGTK